MAIDTTSREERNDLKRRVELQAKLQEALRRSAPASELRRIEAEIEALNQKLLTYEVRTKKAGGQP